MSRIIESLIARLSEYFDPDRLGPLLAGLLLSIVVGIIVLTLFYLLWRVIRAWVLPRWNKRLDKTSSAFLETVLKFAILSIGVVVALGAAGIKTTAVLASLGVVGLTIGFAARDTLSNVISGILIFLDRPFTIDDLVEIEGNYGRIDRISLRSTRIITSDGKMLAVPNTEVMTKTVTSYTNFPHLRLDLEVTIGVEEDIDRVRSILLSIVAKDPAYLTKPAPVVVVTQLNDFNIAVELRVWLDDEKTHLRKKNELREQMYKILSIEKVDMPYETLKVIGPE